MIAVTHLAASCHARAIPFGFLFSIVFLPPTPVCYTS